MTDAFTSHILGTMYGECQNCDWRGQGYQMRELWPDITDLLARIVPGEPAPLGTCPHCGALCQPLSDQEVEALQKLQALECPACGNTDISEFYLRWDTVEEHRLTYENGFAVALPEAFRRMYTDKQQLKCNACGATVEIEHMLRMQRGGDGNEAG